MRVSATEAATASPSVIATRDLGRSTPRAEFGGIYSDYPLERLGVGAAADAHIVLVPNPPQHPLGDFGLGDGEALAEAPVRLTFGCLAVYRAGFFAGCADGPQPLKPLLLRAMAQHRCTAELYSGVWEDVGTPERLHALNAP